MWLLLSVADLVGLVSREISILWPKASRSEALRLGLTTSHNYCLPGKSLTAFLTGEHRPDVRLVRAVTAIRKGLRSTEDIVCAQTLSIFILKNGILWAQATGTVRGTVADSQNKLTAGAMVFLPRDLRSEAGGYTITVRP